MKLEKLALIAEIVGGAAIVITLIVLIIEVRGNTEAVRAATYQDVADSITSIPAGIASDRDLSRIYLEGLRGDGSALNSKGRWMDCEVIRTISVG